MSRVRVIFALPGIGLCSVLSAIMPMDSAYAQQTKAKQISIQYQATLGGLFIGQAKLRIAITPNAYNIAGTAAASGVAKNLYGFSLDVKSYGALANHAIFPTQYSTKYGDAKASRSVTIKYNRQRTAAVSAKPRFYKSRANVALKAAHFKNTVDPLSSLFLPIKKNLSAMAPENCNRVVPAFDGRVRYNLKFTAASPQRPMKKMPHGFKGPVLNCQIKMIPIAGHSKKKRPAKNFETRQKMQVWLTPVGTAGLLVPIKGLVPTPLGVAEIVARKIYVNGQKVAAL